MPASNAASRYLAASWLVTEEGKAQPKPSLVVRRPVGKMISTLIDISAVQREDFSSAAPASQQARAKYESDWQSQKWERPTCYRRMRCVSQRAEDPDRQRLLTSSWPFAYRPYDESCLRIYALCDRETDLDPVRREQVHVV